MATAYQKIPVPSFTSPTVSYTDPEILYSYARFTQKGVTIAGGQGVLPAGQVIAKRTSDKKWVKYNNAGSGGAEIARGVLRRAVDTGTGGGQPDQLGNIVISGILKLNMLVGNDAAAQTDLGATIDTDLGTFKF